MAWTAPRTWATGEYLSAALLNAQLRDNMLAVQPVLGEYRHFATTGTTSERVIGLNFLECNGAAVSRTTYSLLFGRISTWFGAGNGSTTFNVPDLRGRVLVGQGGVLAIGASDGVAYNYRRPQHRHTPHLHAITGPDSMGGPLPRIEGEGATYYNHWTTSVDGGSGNVNDSLDAPAYLVAGSWGIRFVGA